MIEIIWTLIEFLFVKGNKYRLNEALFELRKTYYMYSIWGNICVSV